MVEKWLLLVEETMVNSVRHVIGESHVAYETTDRKRWVLDWPGQVILCTSSIFWTAEVTAAMGVHNGVAVSVDDEMRFLFVHFTSLLSLFNYTQPGGECPTKKT